MKILKFLFLLPLRIAAAPVVLVVWGLIMLGLLYWDYRLDQGR